MWCFVAFTITFVLMCYVITRGYWKHEIRTFWVRIDFTMTYLRCRKNRKHSWFLCRIPSSVINCLWFTIVVCDIVIRNYNCKNRQRDLKNGIKIGIRFQFDFFALIFSNKKSWQPWTIPKPSKCISVCNKCPWCLKILSIKDSWKYSNKFFAHIFVELHGNNFKSCWFKMEWSLCNITRLQHFIDTPHM